MKKLFITTAILVGSILGGTLVTNAATSAGGHYYKGYGSVTNRGNSVSIWVHAKSETDSIKNVVGKVTVNDVQAAYKMHRNYVDMTVLGHPGKTNKSITGAYDSRGYKEVVNARG